MRNRTKEDNQLMIVIGHVNCGNDSSGLLEKELASIPGQLSNQAGLVVPEMGQIDPEKAICS